MPTQTSIFPDPARPSGRRVRTLPSAGVRGPAMTGGLRGGVRDVRPVVVAQAGPSSPFPTGPSGRSGPAGRGGAAGAGGAAGRGGRPGGSGGS
ncbi:hypothetical protein, partial [Aquipuribacter nitratireducens]